MTGEPPPVVGYAVDSYRMIGGLAFSTGQKPTDNSPFPDNIPNRTGASGIIPGVPDTAVEGLLLPFLLTAHTTTE